MKIFAILDTGIWHRMLIFFSSFFFELDFGRRYKGIAVQYPARNIIKASIQQVQGEYSSGKKKKVFGCDLFRPQAREAKLEKRRYKNNLAGHSEVSANKKGSEISDRGRNGEFLSS